MLGIILTGHGNFATGMGSDVELVAGQQEKFQTIDFVKGMTADQLNTEFIQAIEELNNEDGIVFLTDLAGGTPFNQAVILKESRDNIEVIAGVNMPMIMEGLFNRDISLNQFVQEAVQNGKSGVVPFQIKQRQTTTNDGEGI